MNESQRERPCSTGISTKRDGWIIDDITYDRGAWRRVCGDLGRVAGVGILYIWCCRHVRLVEPFGYRLDMCLSASFCTEGHERSSRPISGVTRYAVAVIRRCNFDVLSLFLRVIRVSVGHFEGLWAENCRCSEDKAPGICTLSPRFLLNPLFYCQKINS